jgi:hypothetical protein
MTADADQRLAEQVLRKLRVLQGSPVPLQIKELAVLCRKVSSSDQGSKRADAHRAIERLWGLLATAPHADLPTLWEDAIGKTERWSKG